MYQERLLPHDLETEEAVIGSILIDPDALVNLVSKLEPEHFYRESNRLVFEACLDLYCQQVPADQVSVARVLRDRGDLETTGGMGALSHLVAITPTSFHAEHYAGIITELHRRRQLVSLGGQMMDAAYGGDSSRAVASSAMEQLLVLQRVTEDRRALSASELYDQNQATMMEAIEAVGPYIAGHSTGFTDLDLSFNGWEDGKLYVTGARTSMGKTTFSNALALNLIRCNKSVFIFSLEDSRKAIFRRMTHALAKVDYMEHRRGLAVPEEVKDKLIDALNYLGSGLPLWIDDRRGLRPMDIRATLTALCKTFGKPALVVIDYLTLVKPERDRRNAYENVSETIRELKNVGGELDLPLLCMAQLSRALEGRPDKAKRPTMADFRDTGTIEEVSSCLLGLYRESYYFKTEEEWQKANPGKRYPQHELEVIILKQQEGPVGKMILYCDLPSGFIGNLEREPSYSLNGTGIR